MRTSLTNLKRADDYLQRNLELPEQALFEANLILDQHLKEEVRWLEKSLGVIQNYGRHRLRKQINDMHDVLFQSPQHSRFRKTIMSFFNR